MLKRSRFLFLSALVLLGACAPRGEALLERAEQSLSAGEYRAAMIDLKNYVAKHPEEAPVRVKLALALLELGDIPGAEVEVEKARSLGIDRRSTLVLDCRLLVARNAYERVLEECGAADDPTVDPELAMARGNALLGLERHSDARAEFATAVAARPTSLAAIEGLAMATFASDGAAAAREVLDGAPQAVKEQPRYWRAVGTLEMRADDFEAAERAFATAVEQTKDQSESNDHLAALAGLTQARLRQGKIAEAGESSDRLLEAAPRSPFAKLLAAQVSAGQGDLAAARSLLEEVVSAGPENAEARTMLGVVNLQLGNLGQAEMHLANVVARYPDNVRAQQLLASVRNQLQSPDQTLESLKPALGRPAADPALFALAGRLSLLGGDREAAISYLDQAQSSGQMSAEARLELASGYLAAGEIDRAIEILEGMPAGEGATARQRETLLVAALLRQGKQAEALDRARELAAKPQEDSDAHALAGAIYAAVGQRDSARAEWNRVLESRPEDKATRLNLARLDLMDRQPDAAAVQLNAILETDPTNLVATLGMAAVAESRKDPAESERWVKKAVEDHPESPEVRLAQAQFYLARRDFGEARQAAEESLRLAPKSAPAANVKGLAELGAGDTKAAVASFKQAVEFAPRGSYQMNLARAHFLAGDPDEAIRVMDAMLRTAQNEPGPLALAATLSLQAGQVERAAGYVARLRSVAPDAPGTLRLEGDLAMAQKRYKDALGHYESAARAGSDVVLVAARYRAGVLAGVANPQRPLEDWLEKFPEDPGVRVLLGEHYQRIGDDSAAISEYEKVLGLAQSNVVALNNLAVLYQETGDPRALATAKRAYDAAPANPAVQDTYGWTLVESGELDRGLELIRAAAKALPGMGEVQYHLGAALARKGEVAEARRVLDQVLATPDLPRSVRRDAEAEIARLGR